MNQTRETIIEALQAYDTGRGYTGQCCLTGKDADLEPHGRQEIIVEEIKGEDIECFAEVVKTFVGSDVALNLPKEIENDEEQYEQARELYLDEAQEIVIGCDVPGEWDGEDWCMVEAVPFRVHLRESAEETAKAIVEYAERVLEPLVRELTLADHMLNVLAGWNDEEGNSLPAEKPGEGSVAAMLSEEDLDWQARNQQEGK
jgi:hypothetical protein